MRRERGFTLLEMIVVSALMVIVLNLLSTAFLRFGEAHHRVTLAMSDLEIATRLLEDVKEDLARARRVTVEADGLRLGLGEAEVRYRVDAEEGSVVREGEGPERAYRQAFEAVAFGEGPSGTVAVGLELRKHDPASPYHPRLHSFVLCPNRRD